MPRVMCYSPTPSRPHTPALLNQKPKTITDGLAGAGFLSLSLWLSLSHSVRSSLPPWLSPFLSVSSPPWLSPLPPPSPALSLPVHKKRGRGAA